MGRGWIWLYPLQPQNITTVESWFNWRKARNMKLTALLALAALSLTLAVAAFAAGPATPWTVKDVKTAIRAIGYPRAHAKKLACQGQGTADTVGRFASFRCVATYRRRPRRQAFYIGGQGEGGWLCAGKALSACKLLRHGFVTTAEVGLLGSQAAAAGVAAKGYLVVHNQFPYQVVHFCQPAGTSTWSCQFSVNGAPVTVTVSLKAAKDGYVETATAT